ncbi:MAG TPA: CYTH domain-containing protein [Acidimicrobiales bacterium]|nr:CYTH domain-containing protein [Acidimicrobiales bacterium]
MTAGGRVEREIKLDADPDLVLPDFDAVVPGATVRRRDALELDATYFDAEDLRLLDHGVTVRRRVGEGTRWTVKVPGPAPGDEDGPGGGDAVVRREHDVVDEATDPPAEVRELVAPWLGDAPLAPVARLVSLRSRLDVRVDRTGDVVAEIDDDLVVVHAEGREVGRFREIEIELSSGLSGPDATAAGAIVDAVAEGLVAVGARWSTGRPKVDRALTLIGRR